MVLTIFNDIKTTNSSKIDNNNSVHSEDCKSVKLYKSCSIIIIIIIIIIKIIIIYKYIYIYIYMYIYI